MKQTGKEITFAASDAIVEIGTQDIMCGFDGEYDLTLTIRQNEHEIIAFGSAEEFERLVDALAVAVKAKQENDKNIEQEVKRRMLPTKMFRITGPDTGWAARECGQDVVESHDSPLLEDEVNGIIVHLPADSESVEFLNWLSQAYCIEWSALDSVQAEGKR